MYYTVYLCYLYVLIIKVSGCMNHSVHMKQKSSTEMPDSSTSLKPNRSTNENITNLLTKILIDSSNDKKVNNFKPIYFGVKSTNKVISTTPAQQLIYFHKPIRPITSLSDPSGHQCRISEANIFFDGKCQRILSQGTCNKGHWIILDHFQIPICADRKCPADQIYHKNGCANVTDDNVCNINEIIYIEYTGKTYCDCQQGFIYNSKTNKCFREHDTGECPHSMYQEVNAEGNVLCKKNPCVEPNLLLNEEDNKCYKKDYLGRCDLSNPDFVLIFQASKMIAQCELISERNLFEVPTVSSCPRGSKRDHLNNCQQIITFNKRFSSLFSIPTQFTSRYSSCDRGYIRYPNNTCRKPNSLFSN